MTDPEQGVLDGELEPKFLNDEERMLFAEVMFGDEAIAFLDSDLGRVLRGHLKQNRQESLEALATVGWWRRRKIRQLQNQVRYADSFLKFFREILGQAKSSEHDLAQMREE